MLRNLAIAFLCATVGAAGCSDVTEPVEETRATLTEAQLVGAVNFALGKVATASSFPDASVRPALAVDGNTDGDISHGSLMHTNLEAYPWWQVDLGTMRSIADVVVWNRTDCCTERLHHFYVFVSDVPFASTDVAATVAQPGVRSFLTVGQTLPAGATARRNSITVNDSGRYVRVQLSNNTNTAGQYLQLAEVQVWGRPNLATGRAVTQSSTLGAETGAAKAIDGNVDGDGSLALTSVSHTTAQQTPWWHVDLGSSQSIGDVVLWNRTDCCRERLHKVFVFVSPAPFTSTNPTTTRNQSGVRTFFFDGQELPEGSTFRRSVVPVNASGRYVRVQLSDTANYPSGEYLQLAEVEIRGLSDSVANVTPTLKCVVRSDATHYTAVFGYNNPVGQVEGVGTLNSFSPAPARRSQVRIFQPGNVTDAFTVDFNGSALTWTLGTRTVTASSSSPQCTPATISTTNISAMAWYDSDGQPIPQDDEMSFDRPFHFALPSAFDVTNGSAGDSTQKLEFSYQTGSAPAQVCTYSGSGNRYVFQSCTNGRVAGNAVSGDYISLHIVSGHGTTPTVAGAALARIGTAPAPTEAQPVNLSIDANGDGIPDQLAAMVNSIRTSLHPTADVARFSARMPYSAETRAKGEQIAQFVSLQLGQAPSQAEAINNKIAALMQEMKADPAYAKSTAALASLAAHPPVASPQTGSCVVSGGPEIMGCTQAGVTPGTYNRDLAVDCDFDANNNCSAFPGPYFRTGTGAFPGWTFVAPGDVLLRKGTGKWQTFLYAKDFTHGAVWNGNREVYESLSGGVQLTPVAVWADASPSRVAFGYNNRRRPDEVASALTWGRQRYKTDMTTGFNFNFARSKHNDSGGACAPFSNSGCISPPGGFTGLAVYCSQLVYKIHGRMNVDLDSQNAEYRNWLVWTWGSRISLVGGLGGKWGALIGAVAGGSAALYVADVAVAPDEVRASGAINWYHDGTMPDPPP